MRSVPKGNKNALKHGFYSRHFRQAELQKLDVLVGGGMSLLSEIAALRVDSIVVPNYIPSGSEGAVRDLYNRIIRTYFRDEVPLASNRAGRVWYQRSLNGTTGESR